MPFTSTNLNARRNRPALAIKTHNISKPKLVYEPFLDYSDFGKDVRPLDQIPGAVPLKKAQRAVERRASVKRDEAKLKAAVLKAMESEPAASNAQFKDARRTAVLVQPKVKHQAMSAVVGVWEDQFPVQHQEMSAVVGVWEDQFPAKKPKSKVAKAPTPKPSPIPTVDSWLCGEFPSLYVNDDDVKTICEEVSPRSSTDTLVESVMAFEEKKPVPAPVVEAVVELPIPQPQRPALTLIPLNVAQARADIKYRPECFEAQPAQVKPKRGKSLRFWKKL